MGDHIWMIGYTTNPQVNLILVLTWLTKGRRLIHDFHAQLYAFNFVSVTWFVSLFPWRLPCWALIVTHGTVAARESGGLGRPRHSGTRGFELHGRWAGSAKRSAWDWGRWWVKFSNFALVFQKHISATCIFNMNPSKFVQVACWIQFAKRHQNQTIYFKNRLLDT